MYDSFDLYHYLLQKCAPQCLEALRVVDSMATFVVHALLSHVSFSHGVPIDQDAKALFSDHRQLFTYSWV